MQTISVDTVRTWLEEGRPVTIVDVRPAEERAEWSIPGSIYIDAYNALKAHDPDALASLDLPRDIPVVAVCAAGKTSQIAAEQLAARGLQATSLEGGMKAWSLAWNTAGVVLPRGHARIIQIRRTGKGCLSYLVGDGQAALVIDASLDPQVYLDLAQQLGWRITHALDTHVHADHLSRVRQLAARCGATFLLPDQQRVSFPFTAVHNGDVLDIGSMRLRAIRAPGHTLESTCYLLNNEALFTGDTLFPTGVGRPDLDASPQEARARAEALYDSLHRLMDLPPETLVLAGHTSAPIPFDNVPIMTTLAKINERVTMLHVPGEEFVSSILARIPPTPPNYSRIVRYNEEGLLPDNNVTDLEAGANRCAIS